ncbi:nuclear cap binding protein [Aureococcus anophagefferens]|uniref:Nuclear cap binding protein n=1 Tax=Aureococcus anophagefferens TaxID=44056 RepID=A0ABR1FXT6_AURAN
MTARLLVLSALCAVADGEAIRQDCGAVAVSTDAVALILRGEAFRGLPGVEAQIADPVVRTHVDGRLLRQALGCTGHHAEGAEAARARRGARAGRGYRSAVALRLDAAVFAPVAAPEDPSADAAPVDFLSFDVEEARAGGGAALRGALAPRLRAPRRRRAAGDAPPADLLAPRRPLRGRARRAGVPVDLSVGAQQARETALIRCDPNGAARILVLQEARDLDRDLWAMYRPVRETLTRGLEARAAACGYTVRALSGYRAAKKELRRGDTAIFIGVLWQPFAADCERRDYACVHYVTEPKGRDAHDKSKRPPPGIRELWTYTRAHDWARYAPPGYAPVDDKVDDRVRASRGVAVASFLWLGTAWGKPRRACWDALATKNPKTRGRAESRRDVWSPTAWKQVAKRVDDTAFLNMHKAAGDADAPLEAVRLSALLSLGAVVVSEPALAADRAEFAGMLLEEADFCDGRGWTEATKERLFDGGAAALARWRREAYAAYKAKFDPEAILRRAGVWSL